MTAEASQKGSSKLVDAILLCLTERNMEEFWRDEFCTQFGQFNCIQLVHMSKEFYAAS